MTVPRARGLEGEKAVTNTQAGWYDDASGSGAKRWWDGQNWTDQYQQPPAGGGIAGAVRRIEEDAVAGAQARPAQQGASYVVLQVILKEKLWGTGSGNLTELEGPSMLRLRSDTDCTPSRPPRPAARALVAVTGFRRRWCSRGSGSQFDPS